jgi:hypothetical protein
MPVKVDKIIAGYGFYEIRMEKFNTNVISNTTLLF